MSRRVYERVYWAIIDRMIEVNQCDFRLPLIWSWNNE
jgi:hypothetical protein